MATSKTLGTLQQVGAQTTLGCETYGEQWLCGHACGWWKLRSANGISTSDEDLAMRKIITVFEKRWPSLGNVRRPGLCAFHATQGCGASPSPLPSSSLPPPGPPPEAPLPGTTSPNDRVARRSQLAKQLALGCTKKENSASSVPLRKRFWAEVSVREAKGHCCAHRFRGLCH